VYSILPTGPGYITQNTKIGVEALSHGHIRPFGFAEAFKLDFDLRIKMSKNKRTAADYWRMNLFLILKLLLIWFFVSFILGIVLVDFLNQFRIGGYKLGFWFGQQGSLYCFVAIVFYYAKKMTEIERHFDEE